MKPIETKEEYSKYVDKKCNLNSEKLVEIISSNNEIGLIKDFCIYKGLDDVSSSTVVSIILIGVAAILTGLNIFNKIGKFAGAGSLVPITGFANSIVSPAIEYKSEGYVMGVGGKMFTVAGPVLVFGISASVLIGIVATLFK